MSENNKHTQTGKILEVSEVVTRANNFKVRYILLLTDEGDYSQKLKMECAGKNVDAVQEDWSGREVEVQFNLRGFEYQSKNYVTVAIWKATLLDEAKDDRVEEAETVSAGSNNVPF